MTNPIDRIGEWMDDFEERHEPSMRGKAVGVTIQAFIFAVAAGFGFRAGNWIFGMLMACGMFGSVAAVLVWIGRGGLEEEPHE